MQATLWALDVETGETLWETKLGETRPTALELHFIQCPFPNQFQFGLEKLHPKNAKDFTNQFQFGLETKKMICKTQIPNQIQIGLEQFDEHCQRPENSKRHCASLRPNLDPLFIPKFGFHLCYISRPCLWLGKGIWEEFKISLFCFLRKFHASQLVTSWLWS